MKNITIIKDGIINPKTNMSNHLFCPQCLSFNIYIHENCTSVCELTFKTYTTTKISCLKCNCEFQMTV